LRSRTITIVLLGGIAVLLAGYFSVKGIVFQKDSIPDKLADVEALVNEGRWEEAQAAGREIKQTWERHKYLVTLNYAGADYTALEQSINTIIGAARGRDAASVYAHIEILKDLWRNINRLAPEP